MFKFLKENIIFIVNLIFLIGLFIFISDYKKIPDLNQINPEQIPVDTTINDTSSLQNTSDVGSQPTIDDSNVPTPKHLEDDEEFDD